MNLTKLTTFFISLSVLIVLLVGLVFLLLRFIGKGPSISINTSRAAVVKEIRELQRLETAAFTIEKIIDAGTTGDNVFQRLLFGDRILLIAHGQVIAGFDLSQISENDISIKGTSLAIRLPAPHILVVSLDNTQTRVYDRRRGILTGGEDNLESEARAAAEKSIREAACTSNILKTASDNGRKQLTALFQALGFTQVTLEIPSASCK